MPPYTTYTIPQTTRNDQLSSAGAQSSPGDGKGLAFNRPHSSGEVTSRLKMPYSFSRPSSSDQVASRSSVGVGSSKSNDFASISIKTTITKLNAEITKLRAVSAFHKAEFEEKLLAQREKMLVKVEEEEKNLHEAEKQLQAVREEIDSKEEYIRYIHRRNEKQDEELRNVEEQRTELQQILDEISLEYEDHKTNADMTNREISTLLESMMCLFRDQKTIVESSLALEKKMEEDAEKRMQSLHEMLDAETEFRKKSSELRMMSTGKKLTDTLIGQKGEMKAIIDSFNHDRCSNDGDGDDLPSSPKLLLMN